MWAFTSPFRESTSELDHLDAAAGQTGKRAPVSVRVNPDVDPGTHPYISTGLKETKFGVALDDALPLYRRAAGLANVEVRARTRKQLPLKLHEFAMRRNSSGAGRFLGPEDVAKFNGRPLTDALKSVMVGARFQRNAQGEMNIISARSLNPSFVDYKMPLSMDMPPIKTVILETAPDPGGPYGAKGVGEDPIIAIGPAIANAVYDAIGVRFRHYPITPEQVLEKLRQEKS